MHFESLIVSGERASALLPLAGLVIDQVGLLVVVLITLAGVWLRLYLPRHRMSVEEQMKNNKLTETEARRQVKTLETCATAVTPLGLLLLVLVLWDISN